MNVSSHSHPTDQGGSVSHRTSRKGWEEPAIREERSHGGPSLPRFVGASTRAPAKTEPPCTTNHLNRLSGSGFTSPILTDFDSRKNSSVFLFVASMRWFFHLRSRLEEAEHVAVSEPARGRPHQQKATLGQGVQPRRVAAFAFRRGTARKL